MEPTKDHTNSSCLSFDKTKTSIDGSLHRRVQSSSASNIFTLFRSSQYSQNPISPKESQTLRNSVTFSLINLFAGPQTESAFPDKRPASVVSRLNEEINILSSQLNLTNSTIAFYSQELQNSSEKLENSILALEKLQNKITAVESENGFLKQQIEIQTISKENDKKRFELEQEAQLLDFQQKIQCLVHEGKKEKIVIENYFIDVITNLNHKFLEEVECINKKFKEKMMKLKVLDKESEGSDKETEISTFFIPECVSMLKNSSNASPLPVGHLRSHVDFEELDLSLRVLCGQIDEKNKSNKSGSWQNAAKLILEICTKRNCKMLKNAFLLWIRAESRKRIKGFAEKIEKVLLRVRCVAFISIVKVEKIGILRERILKRRYLKGWSWKCAVVRWNRKDVERIVGIVQVLLKKELLSKYKSWQAIKMFQNNKVIHDKKLLKRCIDQWIGFQTAKSENLSQGFYQWRSSLSMAKLAKLKAMQTLFQ